MRFDYARWIFENVPVKCAGLCLLMADQMVYVFPELRRVRGYYWVNGTQCGHWWCVAPDGEIVDPTAAQFAPGGQYQEVPSNIEPAGRCCNCGSLYFDGRYSPCCTEICYNEYGVFCMEAC